MPPTPRPFVDRLVEKVDQRGPDECWPWTGAKTSAGYGHLSRGGRGAGHVLAHRAMYVLLIGPIPDDTVLDHTCHNGDVACPGNATCPHRSCVNPAHLESVSFGENCMRGRGVAPRNARKTHCRFGHELRGRNIIWSRGSRSCRTCENRRQRERAQKRRTAVGT